MRYSIMGRSWTDNEEKFIGASEIIDDIKDTLRIIEFDNGHVSYEIWVDTVEQKDILFNDLKTFVDENGGAVSWHECSHWEEVRSPCIIAEEYSKKREEF